MNEQIIIKLSPPSDKCRIEITYQRRDGSHIDYHVGGGLTEHAMARECAVCYMERKAKIEQLWEAFELRAKRWEEYFLCERKEVQPEIAREIRTLNLAWK